MKISPLQPDDAIQLWVRFQNGDELAFARLYETHIQVIYNYAKKYTKDEVLIEDTIHNLFIYLWQHKSKLAVPLSVKFYLFSAVKRRIFRELLKRREILVPQELTTETNNHAAENSAETNYINWQEEEERKAYIDNAFGLLTGNQRQAIELKYYNNLSCQEISGIMGLKPDNVYKLISRGLDILKKNAKSNFLNLFTLLFLTFPPI
ncbi:MAG: RNA polymerase sigma factor [Adhaeribacter sp.]